ncbi:MAG: MBOAT family protein [Deltaproteobacteria bacterium]|nr:MBOAT family protein [Deltaproteobacteria bacterium]
MLFHSLDYFYFLALALGVFWMLWRHRWLRLAVLLAASCVFYMAWRPEYILLIGGSTALDFFAGHRIHTTEDERKRKAWLALSLAGNLGLLFTFKYYNFFAGELSEGLRAWGFDASLPLLEAALPVGISFYTFQTLSYTIDIYRRRLEPTTSFIEFACFVTYFPQLVAGPIVRATELLPQLQRGPKLEPEKASKGLFLIATGLIKKVAIADLLATSLVDRVFEQPELFTATEVVVALYAFTMQLYCDFSGYTDVARGSAMLFGLELPENFDRPYQATSPADFWRRWHMTLSRWLRDYLYFPLGGSRVGPVRAYVNLFITMFLVGIWHGWWANFEVFFWYALLQAVAMTAHRFAFKTSNRRRDAVDEWPVRALKIFANLQFVVFSRILFRSTSMENAEAVTNRLFSETVSTAQVSLTVWLLLAATFVAHYLPRRVFLTFEQTFVKLPAVMQGVVLAIVAMLLSLVATAEAVPFIYFQF